MFKNGCWTYSQETVLSSHFLTKGSEPYLSHSIQPTWSCIPPGINNKESENRSKKGNNPHFLLLCSRMMAFYSSHLLRKVFPNTAIEIVVSIFIAFVFRKVQFLHLKYHFKIHNLGSINFNTVNIEYWVWHPFTLPTIRRLRFGILLSWDVQCTMYNVHCTSHDNEIVHISLPLQGQSWCRSC